MPWEHDAVMATGVAYAFRPAELKFHPLRRRLAAADERASWVRIGMYLLAAALIATTILGGFTSISVLALIAWSMLALASLFNAHELDRLRRDGVLRDLDLAGIPPLLMLAVFHKWSKRHFIRYFAIGLFPQIAYFLIRYPTEASEMLPVIGSIATFAPICWWAYRRPQASEFVLIQRFAFIRMTGPGRYMNALGLLSQSVIWTLPPGFGAIIPILLIGCCFGHLPAERRLDKLPNDDFLDWIREWSVNTG